MKIREMRNRLVLTADSGMWLYNESQRLICKQVVVAEGGEGDWCEITEAEKVILWQQIYGGNEED